MATIDDALAFLAAHEVCGVQHVRSDVRTDQHRRVMVVALWCERCNGTGIYDVPLPDDGELRRWGRAAGETRGRRGAGAEPSGWTSCGGG